MSLNLGGQHETYRITTTSKQGRSGPLDQVLVLGARSIGAALGRKEIGHEARLGSSGTLPESETRCDGM